MKMNRSNDAAPEGVDVLRPEDILRPLLRAWMSYIP